jgi:hypothetical protein
MIADRRRPAPLVQVRGFRRPLDGDGLQVFPECPGALLADVHPCPDLAQ